MLKMKKCFTLAIAFIIAFCLAACSNADSNVVDTDGSLVNAASNVVDTDSSLVNTDSNLVNDDSNLVNGDSYYDDSYYGDDYYDVNGDDSYADYVEIENHDNDLGVSFYKLDDDHIHVVVNDRTGKLMSRVTEAYVNLVENDSQVGCVRINRDYSEMLLFDADHNVYFGECTGFAFRDNDAFATFTIENFEEIFKVGVEYAISCSGVSKDYIYGLGIVETPELLSSSEYADLYSSEPSNLSSDPANLSPNRKANAAWAQDFICENTDYSDEEPYKYGFANISVTDEGWISLDMSQGDSHISYILEETEYGTINKYGGEVFEAVATLPGGDDSVELRIYQDDPSWFHLNYRLYIRNDENYYDETAYELYPFSLSLAAAPSDFKDKDEYGYVEAILKDRSNYLYPATDNYVIRVLKTTDDYRNYDTGASAEYPCMKITIYEYDQNDIVLSERSMFIYDDETTADKMQAYKKKKGNYYDEYIRQGNVICFTDVYTAATHSTAELEKKKSLYFDETYVIYDGMHYAYGVSDDYDICYVYSSKPFIYQQYDLDTIMTMFAIPEGCHSCTDSYDYTMDTSLNVYSNGLEFRFSASEYSYNANNYYCVHSGDRPVFRNNVGISIDYLSAFDLSGIVVVSVTELSATEATATIYRYRVDSLDNVQITMDNYQEFTPLLVQTHTFDMTSIVPESD